MPFTAVDLSQLPAPEVVEQKTFQEIFDEMLADLQLRDTVFDALVESDPSYKILEVCAYRELLIRQRVNEGALAVMLAHAKGSDLDQIAARYFVSRLVITPADPNTIPPTPAVMESDADFLQRILLIPEAWSSAGPTGAYKFYALSADADVLDANPISPSATVVNIVVLSRTGDGTASTTLQDAVEAAVSADEVRPLTDNVTVQSATINTYTIDATLTFFDGPDRAVVMAAAQEAVEAYTSNNHRIGRTVTLSGIYAAVHQAGVANVTLTSPVADQVATNTEANYCTSITLTDGGVV